MEQRARISNIQYVLILRKEFHFTISGRRTVESEVSRHSASEPQSAIGRYSPAVPRSEGGGERVDMQAGFVTMGIGV
jgi:hypothetical protein